MSSQDGAGVEVHGKEPTLRVVPMPADANHTGDIFGGWIMAQVDIAGSILAVRRAKGRVATVAVNSFVFKQPVMIGDLVSFYAEVTKVGRTSITVGVSSRPVSASKTRHVPRSSSTTWPSSTKLTRRVCSSSAP